jgi:hypothetical protein
MKTTIKLLFLVLISISINACNDSGVKQETKNQAATTETAACSPDEIPASEATTMIDDAKVYIDGVNSTLPAEAMKIPYGAKIPVCEMQELLNKLGNTPETWAMMAMENGELTIIFQGKKEGGSEYVYYDFTTPCPDVCPQ